MTHRALIHLFVIVSCAALSGCLHEPDLSKSDAQSDCMPQAAGEIAAGQDCDEPAQGRSTGIDPSDRSQYPGAEELKAIVDAKRSELYGTEAGDRIEALTFIDGDEKPYGLADVHKDPTRKLILFTTSAGWCAACIEEQPTLQAMHEEFNKKGLTIMVVLFEYQDYSPGDARLAKQWKRRYNLDYTVLADPTFISRPYYPNGDASATPLVMLIDVGTMTIIDVATGFNEDVVRSIIDKTL